MGQSEGMPVAPKVTCGIGSVSALFYRFLLFVFCFSTTKLDFNLFFFYFFVVRGPDVIFQRDQCEERMGWTKVTAWQST